MQISRSSNQRNYSQNNAYFPSKTRPSYNNDYEKPNTVLSALLYILTTASLCVFIALIVLRSLGVGHVIRNTDILSYLEEASAGEHTYYIVDQINNLPFSNTEVTLWEVEQFVQNEAVTDEIGTILDGYANAFVMGNHDHHVTTGDIVKMARNLEPEFSEFFDHRMTESDYEQMANTLDDILDFNSLTVSGLMEDFDVDLSVPLVLISPALMWAVGTLCVLLLAAIFILRKDNLADASLATGIPLVASGLLTFIGGLYIGTHPEIFGDVLQRYSRFIDDPAHLLSQYGFLFAAVGILIIIISFMLRKVAQKDRRR